MSGREVLAAYWGEDWPAIEAYLGERVAAVDTYWAGPGDELGQPEDVLEGIVEELFAQLDKFGGAPRRIAQLCGADPSPFSTTRSFAFVLERARTLSGATGPEEELLPPARRQHYEAEVRRICQGLGDEWAVLDACVRDLIAEQLSHVDRFTRPRLGHLTICPLMNLGPPPEHAEAVAESAQGRWFVPFTALARDRQRCKFVAQWCVDLSEDPRCAAAIAGVTRAEDLVRAELEALAYRLAEELR